MLTTPWRLLITCRTRYKVLTKADSKDMNLSKLREIVKDRETWRAAVHGVTKSWTRLSDWTTTTGLSALEDVLRSELHSHLLWESSLNLEGWTQVLLMLSPACAHAVSVSSLLHCVEMSNDLPSFVLSISPAQRRVSFVLLAWPYSWHRSGCSLNTYWMCCMGYTLCAEITGAYNQMVKRMRLGVRPSGFKSWPAVWPWASYLTPLCINVSFLKWWK